MINLNIFIYFVLNCFSWEKQKIKRRLHWLLGGMKEPLWRASIPGIYRIPIHGRLATWRKWRACDVGEANEGLKNELWRRWSNGRAGEWSVTYVKRRKGWRMSCDVGEVTEMLENELCFIYVTAHSPTLLLLHLRHNLFSNPYFVSPTSQALHLRHLANRPWSWIAQSVGAFARKGKDPISRI